MARQRKQEEAPPAAEWMNTYADMVTLLLCFFVLLFAMSKADEGRIKAFMAGFDGGAGVLDGGQMLEFEKNLGQMLEGNVEGISEEELGDLQGALQAKVEAEGLSGQIDVLRDERGIVIRVMDKIFFDPGEAVIKSESYPILRLVASILNAEEFKKRSILVEGHTDDDPVKNPYKYPTNWELSSARAVNVARFLIESTNVNPVRISPAGYSYYHPIAPNDSPENKAKNRRADIVILGETHDAETP